MVSRFDVYMVSLDPTEGSEIRKTRPCVIISPDELNRHLATVIVAPLTSGGQSYPTRTPCDFDGKSGRVALDQMRSVHMRRLHRRAGSISADEQRAVLDGLAELFAE